MKNYTEVRIWLENFIPLVYGKEQLGLKKIENLLEKLGNPEKQFKSIHVAGTSGKGSTCFYISQLLMEKGYKVGLHLSPHLVYVGERMQILDNRKQETGNRKQKEHYDIPVKRFVGLVNEIKPVVDDIATNQPQFLPSYFEILVALSFLYFAKQKVDFAVVEVGLGGRLDATNVLLPKISVITNIGLDHTEILGDTVEKIAKEKAGIIKNNVPIVTGATGNALKVIEKVAKSKCAQLIKLDTQNNLLMPKTDLFGYVNEPYYTLRSASSSFVSKNQNLALLTVLALGIKLNNKIVDRVMNSGYIGRFEQISDRVVVDGAHNADKMRSLIEFVRNSKLETRNSKITLVLAFKTGKNWKEMVDILFKNLPIKSAVATQYFASTDMGKGSAVGAEEIRDYVAKVSSVQCKVISNSQEAVFEAVNSTVILNKKEILRSAQNDKGEGVQNDKLVLVTGSLYLVGEARTLWYLPEF